MARGHEFKEVEPVEGGLYFRDQLAFGVQELHHDVGDLLLGRASTPVYRTVYFAGGNHREIGLPDDPGSHDDGYSLGPRNPKGIFQAFAQDGEIGGPVGRQAGDERRAVFAGRRGDSAVVGGERHSLDRLVAGIEPAVLVFIEEHAGRHRALIGNFPRADTPSAGARFAAEREGQGEPCVQIMGGGIVTEEA